MLIIPIPQEEEVRRQPWVTYILMLACLVAFLSFSNPPDLRERVGAQFEEAITYLLERPYLEPPEALAELAGPRLAEELEQLRPRARRPVSTLIVRQQIELDTRTETLMETLRSRFQYRYGLVAAHPRLDAWIISMFLHGGWLHLIGNMLFLYLTGPFVEDVWGRILYPLLYLTGGIAASAAQVAVDPTSEVPLIGASGAIAAVMGAYLVRFSLKRIKLLVVPIPFAPMFRFTVMLPAITVLPMWLLEQLWYAGEADPTSGGVAWWAHIGGFAYGLLVALVILVLGIEERWIHPAIEAKTGFAQDPALTRAIEARLAGDLTAARRELRAALSAKPSDLDTWSEALELGIAEESAARVSEAAARLFDLYARAREPELARQLVADLEQIDVGPLSARCYLAVATFLDRDGDGRSALDYCERVCRVEPDSPTAFRALLRRGDILQKAGDPQGARQAWEAAAQHPACVPPWPHTIQEKIAALA